MEARIIDRFDKNALQELRTQITTFRGHELLDIRVFVKPDPSEDKFIPTKKGISIKTELLPKLKKAIAKAEKVLKEKEEKANKELDKDKLTVSV